MQTRLLLGPAGSGKTFRCLTEIREALLAAPDGPPLLLLAPKQATFQLERQLLADSPLTGYTRLHILSFERLAGFVFEKLRLLPPEMLDEQGPLLPHAWIAGDDELGRSSWFRQELRSRGECYLLAVPSNTLVRDLMAPDPPYQGRGPRPKVPFTRVDRWCAELPESLWQAIEVRDGDKGPLVTQAVRRLVQARTEGKPSDVAEFLVVFRERQEDGS